MGKNLIQQRRGKGNTRYRSPSHKFVAKPQYAQFMTEGVVSDIIYASGRKIPFAVVDTNGKQDYMIPADGVRVGQKIIFNGPVENGNVLELDKIPEGTKIFNVELRPLDGGKICRAPGSFALLTTRSGNKAVIILPSKKQKILSSKCRATIGVPAGAGRKDKPLLKAGKQWFNKRSSGKLYPIVTKTKMNPVDHPFGGRNFGKQKTVSRNAPPGAKVGSIAPRRTGKRKR
jgi:large subunit ribosomal protein L2